MGIFDTTGYVRHGSQKISERFLKKMGFHKDYWGSPHENYKKPCSLFWEKYIFDEEDLKEWGEENASIVATIWYFPETFTGYVTPYNMYGKNPAHGTFCQTNNDDPFEKCLYSHCKMDIIYVIDFMKQYINENKI